ncbi:uncharacterized protein LOC135489940 [Lineus longissimus]|uniref:uncharacterized protein LOC135489940 n=1 Tax=Lineus longissimus TaxID=88925 RepID=UPI00315CDD75
MNYIQTYALLDSGSNGTFCARDLVDTLALSGIKKKVEVTTLEKRANVMDTAIFSLEVADLGEREIVGLPSVIARPDLHISPTAMTHEEIDKHPHLKDIEFPVVEPGKVQLLIGQDVPEALIPLEVKRGEGGAPYAVRTALGWTLNGPTTANQSSHATAHFINSVDLGLQKQVEQFWKLENIGGDDQGMSVNDQKVISLWDKEMKHENGQYVLPIPFKCEPPSLPNNLIMATRRLELLGRRLQKDTVLHQKYTTEITQLVNKGYAEVVPPDEIGRKDGCVWYLPHHPVINPKKQDKTRIVFDCAAKFRETSLNDNIYQGPDLTNKLVGVLIRFRQDQVAFIADMEAMFHMAEVTKDCRDTLRFLFWENGDLSKPPTTYRMTRHLFGGVRSSSCANYALKRTAKDNEADFSQIAKDTVDNCHYVDDCLKSIPKVGQGIQSAHDLCKLLALGGFHLTKWISNSRELLKAMPDTELTKEVRNMDLDRDGLPTERALGLLRDVGEDTFRPSINRQERPPTKRGVLSILSLVYDPLGLVSPYILLAKLMFQDLCRNKVGWDENRPDSNLDQWKKWCEDLPKLENFRIPHCLKSSMLGPVAHSTLHHFADASERGLEAASYLRTEDPEGKVHCVLVMSKAKLAPIKTTTIPRLELAAAVESWRHVDTANNPADDVSRGLTADELIDSTRRTNGPSFLWKPECDWPQTPSVMLPEDDSIHLEEKPQLQVFVAENPEKTAASEDILMKLIERHSNWYKLKKSVAWILRARKVLRNKALIHHHDSIGVEPIKDGELSVDELKRAEVELVKFAQRDINQDTRSQSRAINKLSPQSDINGVLRVGGRLNNAVLPHDAKHPMILPKKHHIVDLIVHHYHNLTGNSGTEHALTEIRQRFWIVKGRVAVRRAEIQV